MPTLEVLAYCARNQPSLICPVISAGTRDTVYAAFYRISNSNPIRIGEYYVGDVAGLSAMVKEPAVFVGSELHSYHTLAGTVVKVVEAVPNGVVVAQLAVKRFEDGESDDVLSLSPLYLKESTARAFQRGHNDTTEVKG